MIEVREKIQGDACTFAFGMTDMGYVSGLWLKVRRWLNIKLFSIPVPRATQWAKEARQEEDVGGS